jgi:dihydroneopterin aldolase
VAGDIADAILAAYPLVQEIEVTLHKPFAPLPDRFRDAAVRLVRKRA